MPEQLSPWWGRAVALTFVLGFGVLILLTVTAYRNAPPVAARLLARRLDPHPRQQQSGAQPKGR